jgi:hypothetical protein
MADRASAQRFKKLLYDIFEGNIVWRETPELPGGVKEQILDLSLFRYGSYLRRV